VKYYYTLPEELFTEVLKRLAKQLQVSKADNKVSGVMQ
jgi:hypothetical protein